LFGLSLYYQSLKELAGNKNRAQAKFRTLNFF